MKVNKLIEEIESKYETKKVRYRDLSLWLEFRNRFFFSLSIGKESNLIIDKSVYFAVLRSVFYGFFNWFKTYNVWVLSASNYRIKIEDKYFDKFFDYPASKVDKTLFIELSVKPHFKRSQIFSKYIVSRAPLIILEKVISMFLSLKKVDFSIYKEIQAEYKTEIDPVYSIKKMIAQYKSMQFLLFFKKQPKFVFIAPSYMSFGYVKALKEKGVKIIEAQHGVINKEHFGYNYHEKYDSGYFPDYLLTFGEREKRVFSETNTFIKKNNVVPVGSYYIDYIEEKFKLDINTSDYRLTFSVSMQDCDIGGKVLPFLLNVASENKDCLFLLKPRRTPVKEYTSKYQIPSNMMFVENHDVYQTILHSDFHITAFSSCALEAPALGVKNVLLNFENKAKEYYFDILHKETSYYVSSEKLFNQQVKQLTVESKHKVKALHKEVISTNYQQNINDFLKMIED